MISKEIRQTIALTWPLFAGLAMIMLGNGLQGTLLGLRASLEGFSSFTIGAVMSLYYLGFVLGSFVVPKMISSVGHIRVFAAFASIASTTILMHGVFVDPWVWAFIRIFSGLSFAGLFIISESWLNSIATNKLRGQIFGVYLFVIHGGLFAGQFLIALGSLESIGLFILISILISLSMVPLVLADKPSPGYQKPDALPLKKLIKNSHFSMVSVFFSGFCGSALFGIGSVYATNIGLSKEMSAIFVACFISGCATIPLVTGWLSDHMDRRLALVFTSGLGCLSATMIVFFPETLFVSVFIYGGMVTSVYSIGIAFMNDNIKSEQMVSASTTLVLINGIGATLGPVILGSVMDFVSVDYFFVVLACVMGNLFIFGIYRAIVGDKVNIEDQSDFIPVPARSSPSVIQITEDD